MPRLALRPLTLLLALTALALPSQASAAFFGGDVIDGPVGGTLQLGDVDIARDGTGAVAYLKDDGGVPHLFVSRLIGGGFQSPERLDPGLGAGASQPAVAASDGGRIVVAFRSGGQLNVVVRPNASSPFLPPQALADGAYNPSVDMSIHGVAYVSFTQPGASAADVRVARLQRQDSALTVLPEVLDIVPGQDAGTGAGRSRTAVSADGTAVVVWGEADHVYARRVFRTRVSQAPQDMNLAGGGVADLPEISIEDDSSYAWAVARQRLADGRLHTVARRLRGSRFEDGVQVDGTGSPGAADTSEVAIAISGRGEGIAATAAGGGLNAALLHRDAFFGAVPLGAAGAPALPTVGIAENGDAYAAFVTSGGGVQLNKYDISPTSPGVPPPSPPNALAPASLGAVDPASGLDLGVNRAGDSWAVFVQQDGGGGRRLVAGGFDREPGQFRTYTSSRYRRFSAPTLTWQSAFELQGALTYRVEIDGQPVGETNDRTFTVRAPLADGIHPWRVVATDRRGQTAAASVRLLRVDSTPPDAALRLTGTKRAGRTLKLLVRATDTVAPVTPEGTPPAPAITGSGVRSYRVDWGDKSRPDTDRRASHRYAKPGRYTIRVSVKDAAGNVTVERKRITVAKAKKT